MVGEGERAKIMIVRRNISSISCAHALTLVGWNSGGGYCGQHLVAIFVNDIAIMKHNVIQRHHNNI